MIFVTGGGNTAASIAAVKPRRIEKASTAAKFGADVAAVRAVGGNGEQVTWRGG